MEILVAILIIALVAAVVFIVLQRRRSAPGTRTAGRPESSPLPPRSRRSARHDPMAAAVEEHAQATDPHEVVAAEQRLRAQARQVAAGMSADANPPTAADYQPGAPAFDDGSSAHVPPSNGHAGSGYGQVGSPRVDDALERPPDPEIPADYDSRNYDGRRAEDWQAYQDRRDAER